MGQHADDFLGDILDNDYDYDNNYDYDNDYNLYHEHYDDNYAKYFETLDKEYINNAKEIIEEEEDENDAWW